MNNTSSAINIVLEDVHLDFRIDLTRPTRLLSAISHPFRKRSDNMQVIHALRGINLEVEAGERVGIIGRNGAGKTTLLKVLAGIYTPQRGEVHISGHTIPLFEFVTGFEMEASGWDNIRTRGLLLGLSNSQINQNILKIGEFTKLGSFLDLPVRVYSSGMLLRLAFATSTAIDPDILLLDEIMAAGDAAFIDSARKRMEELIERAGILVFVSHSLDVLPSFCSRSIWLDEGKIRADGPTAEIIKQYRQEAQRQPSTN